jgi:hypothetical protein
MAQLLTYLKLKDIKLGLLMNFNTVKIMINRQSTGLKGQLILAQGNPEVGALDWRTGKRIVRVLTFIKEKILFRTMCMALCSSGKRSLWYKISWVLNNPYSPRSPQAAFTPLFFKREAGVSFVRKLN